MMKGAVTMKTGGIENLIKIGDMIETGILIWKEKGIGIMTEKGTMIGAGKVIGIKKEEEIGILKEALKERWIAQGNGREIGQEIWKEVLTLKGYPEIYVIEEASEIELGKTTVKKNVPEKYLWKQKHQEVHQGHVQDHSVETGLVPGQDHPLQKL